MSWFFVGTLPPTLSYLICLFAAWFFAFFMWK